MQLKSLTGLRFLQTNRGPNRDMPAIIKHHFLLIKRRKIEASNGSEMKHLIYVTLLGRHLRKEEILTYVDDFVRCDHHTSCRMHRLHSPHLRGTLLSASCVSRNANFSLFPQVEPK